MGRSFGLAAYRAWSRRTASKAYSPKAPRPKGQVVWIHAPESRSLLAISDLALRLCALRAGLSIIITARDALAAEEMQRNIGHGSPVTVEVAPSEHPLSVASFWRHWAPDMGLWAWGELRPNLIQQAHEAGCPMILIDADAAAFDRKRDRWLPELSKNLLLPFVALMVRSTDTLKRLESLGLSTREIELTPPLEAGGRALPCDDSQLDDLSQQLKGRPVWFASHVAPSEYSAVLTAHRQAQRLSHRLLLVVFPANSEALPELYDAIAKEEFRYVNWSESGECDDATQVILVDDANDLGLFYRASPVTFMGSSLADGDSVRNPFEAAALGSAILYGPKVRRFSPFYARLASAGAARIVKDADSLASAIIHLIAPDRAAHMAHAGWDVISRGADITDRVIDLVQSGLDGELESTDARA